MLKTIQGAPEGSRPQTSTAAPSTREQRLRRFGDELEALRRRTFAKIGEPDAKRVRRLERFSRSMEVVGRVLIHVSFEPITFVVGVLALWVHRQLQAMEIGHSALHGAYDGIPGLKRFDSKKFRWETPIDEESWRYAHNVRHHGHTNIAGKDADINFGPVRLTEHTAHRPEHKWQLPFTLLFLMPSFGFFMNFHVTGVHDAFFSAATEDKLDFLPDRSWKSRRTALYRALRKYGPYYAWNYGVFPALAGPMFWKVALGNYLAELLRDLYSAATIFCGHVGEDTASYPEGTKARGRGEWFAMQVEASNNFAVSRPLSVLCGGLDYQIEHHLFPTLPPERLREIAPEVEDICNRHGVNYKRESWPRTLKKAFAQVIRLSHEGGPSEVLRAMT